MGFVKSQGERWDGLVECAKQVAVRAGSITKCVHETALDEGNEEPAYQLAEREFKNGDLKQFESIEEIKAALDEVFSYLDSQCSACAKNQN